MPGTPLLPEASSSWLGRLASTGRALLDLIYPPRCAACGRPGALFCPACEAGVIPITPPVCRRCGRPMTTAGLCSQCRRRPSSLDGILSTAVFAPPLRPAIHHFKYRNAQGLAVPFGARMANTWHEAGLHADLFAPVPLHAARQAERGYNQSMLLAMALSKATGIPLASDLLVRQRATLPQTSLGWQKRHENVSGAFVCCGDPMGKRIVLIDDVCTTGATLEACADALKANGARDVWALTLARARWEPGTT